MFLSVLLTLVLHVGTSSARDPFSPGTEWLKMSDDARVAYVYGYVWGVQRGFYDACVIAEKMWVAHPKGLPGQDCVAKMPGLSKTPEQCAEVITDYYRSYPEDSTVPVRRLLEGFLSPREWTVRQLHEEYGPGAKKLPPQ
jgi:hypothetical protein